MFAHQPTNKPISHQTTNNNYYDNDNVKELINGDVSDVDVTSLVVRPPPSIGCSNNNNDNELININDDMDNSNNNNNNVNFNINNNSININN